MICKICAVYESVGRVNLPRQIPIRILVTSADVLHALFDSSLFTFFEREYNTVTG